MTTRFKEFIKLESSGGIVLVLAAVLAMVVANSPLRTYYGLLIDMPVEIRVGPMNLAKPLLLWINDGMMAIFFFVVGLELKRELIEGDLSDPRNIILPALGAIGGMVAPALMYVAFNSGDPVALNGWAIPAATDIAFALGIVILLGNRVPASLKVFLISLAIFDDMGAILIIAAFYTKGLSVKAMMVALACVAVLLFFNLTRVTKIAAYGGVGVILWIAVLKSGVHATLAGVVLAFFIPMIDPREPGRSPLREIEQDLHAVVTFAILPLFAFANAGISLNGGGLQSLLHPVPLGIAVGLFVGKQVGVFSFSWIGIKLGIARLPEGANWCGLYGVALLCGVGFTMSLFIGSLAFERTGVDQFFDERLGIIAGSLLSGLAGYFVLRRGTRFCRA